MHTNPKAGLGFAPAIAIATNPAMFSNPVTAVAAGALSAVIGLISFLNIGEGRNTADLIVPTQNQIGVSLTQINNRMDAAGLSELEDLWMATIKIGQQFDQFLVQILNNGGDARAVTQARQTIFPLIDGSDGLPVWPSASNQTIRADGGTLGSIRWCLERLGGDPNFSTLTLQQYGPPSLQPNSFQYNGGPPAAGRIQAGPPDIYLAGNIPSGANILSLGSGDASMLMLAGLAALFLLSRKSKVFHA